MLVPAHTPTVTLHVTPETPASVRCRMRTLLTARCPCHVVFGTPTAEAHVTYELRGQWPISPARVRAHLIAVFAALVTS